MSIKLEIVTPTGKLLETQTDEVTAPGFEGEFSILPSHRPALIRLGGGAITHNSGKVFVRGGVAEVRSDGVLILADQATLPEAIDAKVAQTLIEEVNAAFAESEFLEDDRVTRLAADRAYAEAMLAATH